MQITNQRQTVHELCHYTEFESAKEINMHTLTNSKKSHIARKVDKIRAFCQNPTSMNAMTHWYFLKLSILDTLTEILEKLHHSESMCYASTCGFVGKSPILCDRLQYNKILSTIMKFIL